MTEEERKILLESLEKRKKKTLKSKRAALQYLIAIGLYTEKGNLRAPYNVICTPEEAA